MLRALIEITRMKQAYQFNLFLAELHNQVHVISYNERVTVQSGYCVISDRLIAATCCPLVPSLPHASKRTS